MESLSDLETNPPSTIGQFGHEMPPKPWLNL